MAAKPGEVVYTMAGHCPGPQYGVVVRAKDGGYIAGYRRTDCEGVGMMGERYFSSRRAAEDYAYCLSFDTTRRF